MIWIIGGTKDSRIILDEVMKVREDDIVVSTATEYGWKFKKGDIVSIYRNMYA